MHGEPERPLVQLDVFILDCQATGAAPRGHLLEIAWTRTRPAAAPREIAVDAHLVRLPAGERIPPAVARITGITNDMVDQGSAALDPGAAWCRLESDLLASAATAAARVPAVIHFGRFERPFLDRLAGGAAPFDVVCTHAVARRLLPGLPRCSLRALAGYLGRAVTPLRRSADHVEATAFAWRELVPLLAAEGVTTWEALQAWLARPRVKPLVPATARARRRVWPMPRGLRLGLPAAPGIYRMLRINGEVLYVGKAAALHHRVNSYFQKQQHIPERLLEMLSQARGLSYDVTPTALEAALVETDEIKRHRPPYNIALTLDRREVWFTATDLSGRAPCLSAQRPLGPLVSADTLDRFAALARGDRAALSTGRWGPEPSIFTDGYARFCQAHRELTAADGDSPQRRLLRVGTRLWREGRRDRDADEEPDGATRDRDVAAWTPELVQVSLEWLAIRAALDRRRAIWLTRLTDAALQWREPGADTARLLIVEQGEIVERTSVAPGAVPPVPPGSQRTISGRRAAFGLACFDRLRVLTTEMKRLVAAGAPVSLRLHAGPALAGERLAAALRWL